MNNKFGYEIDFLPVGSGRSGDAISVRYGVQGNYKIMIVDGGTKESGKKLVEHIKKYYKTSYVDYVVNTHPDQDHASGLTEVLNNLEVGELWIHCPWNYAKEIIEFIDDKKNDYTRDQRITFKSFEKRLAGSYYKYAKELENMAKEKNIPIKEPYKGCNRRF
ncbi:MBL fold metallo-hydrolase [Campylobacter jejuni]|nr:MBL fold metallo-hydrolase [Campylobacter jejuni]EIX0490286.1 MBL fold metallo-hydrolase [Campylobacter jejuni]